MLFIIEGIGLALLIQIFKGFKSTLPSPAGFANFRGGGRGKTCFLRGGAHIPADKVADIVWTRRLARSPTSDVFF